jgi:hypothetical protein
MPGLSAGIVILTSQADIANTTAFSFLTVYSPDKHDPEFRGTKNSGETLTLSFTLHFAEA